ncbi:MAG TPA: 4-(cytidine 5'-diphospho)-2-C-methyl-D-erythritol kinase [Candidatus Sulfopaludibacter sp.]|jgi:4-diphosphocytidyl-2-C-methyl-D-erythritol kinase|nr:4-(cytidine 5'-diphospho)-2-C-methyl-D-erythritol kinase [Candidatus Sulfopaludibacter sp.]
MSIARRVRVRALAKINLDLRVLGKRPDGYHELRTIFQTISLADTLEIGYTPARQSRIELSDGLNIPDNLVTKAARLAMDAMRASGRVEMKLTKLIPMGAGLGGGSSDAAAVLLALPALVGRPLGLRKLSELAQELGSDVSFFLLGGTAAGIGRGTELYPLPDAPSRPGILVAPGLHVNTAQAYRDLSPRLTTELQQNKIFSFQSHTFGWGGEEPFENDFEPVVFEQHRSLAEWKKRLKSVGASVALMTGSGSALFGLFDSSSGVTRAMDLLGNRESTHRISLVSRARYRAAWWKALDGLVEPKTWPPRTRDAR